MPLSPPLPLILPLLLPLSILKALILFQLPSSFSTLSLLSTLPRPRPPRPIDSLACLKALVRPGTNYSR